MERIIDRLDRQKPSSSPPNFKLPKRCSICNFWTIKGFFRIRRGCSKHNVLLGGIGCCSDYVYMVDEDD
ncbi:MAG: hypothetical protein KAS32_04560 [Candidatus Peribacteraceae bacterium]|nr:hypothetical protein [Candidatus Peribacteraceae bacterium]